jgi:hypothetical protein
MATSLVTRPLLVVGFIALLFAAPAFAEQAGLIFTGGDSTWALHHEAGAKRRPAESTVGSPYRFPPDWNPGHAYPDPAANGWSFAEDNPFGIVPMVWDAEQNRWEGGGGTIINQTEILPSGSNTAKLCLHADVSGDSGLPPGTSAPYTVKVNVLALPGGASLHIFVANSREGGDLPNPLDMVQDITSFHIQGNQTCHLTIPGIQISECQWIVFEVDDPSVAVAPGTWGLIKSRYR